MATKDRFLSIKAALDILYDLELAFQDAEGWVLILSVYPAVGKSLLETMKREHGLELRGKKINDVLTNITHLLVDEYKIADNIKLEWHGEETVHIEIDNCVLLPVEHRLIEKKIKPFLCPFKNLMALAMDEMATDEIFEGFTESLVFEVKDNRCEHGLNLFKLRRDKTLQEILQGIPFEKTLEL